MKQLLATLFVLAVVRAHNGFDRNSRLDGGEIAGDTQFKWHVHVAPHGVQANFSGIFIDEEWVLTCAACINKADTHTFIFGARNLDIDAEPGRITLEIPKESVILHPEYDAAHFNEKNIALVRLPSPILPSAYVDVIRLADGNSTYDNIIARVSGFGFETNGATSGTQLLRYADLTIQPDSNCRNLQEGQMCAQVITEIGPCRDEGSALVYTESDGKGTAVGVFSYGYAEGSCPGERTLFTRVSTYIDWIEETMSGGGAVSTTPAPFDEYSEEAEEEEFDNME